MITKVKQEELFSTPLLKFQVEDHESLDAALLAEGANLRSADTGASKSNRNGWHSSGNLFDETAQCFQTLRGLAETSVESATRSIKAKADLDNLSLKLFAWMNMNPTGGYNAPHTHPGAHWSGVYYVNQPTDVEDSTSGKIEFLSPRADLPNWRILKAPSFRLKKSLRPKAGEIVLFPSYLVHWVYPNESNDERVTIAFNATYRKPSNKRT